MKYISTENTRIELVSTGGIFLSFVYLYCTSSQGWGFQAAHYKVYKLQGFKSLGSVLVPLPTLPSPSPVHYEYEYRDHCAAMWTPGSVTKLSD